MSNRLKLSLENFQSISEGELLFEEGLNFIIGQSNSGKSATFRALKACLSNPKGSQRFIKNGAKKASVTLEYDGNSINWNRTEKESNYYINGGTYLKTGNSDAFKILMDSTGFAKDSNDIIMNIEEELQLPFPFGISDSELFKLFENVFCVSDSATILKAAKDQEEKVKGSIASLEADISKATLKLEALEAFKKEIDLSRLNKYLEELLSKRNRLSILKDGLDIIQRAVRANKEDFSFSNLILENKKEAVLALYSLKTVIEKTRKIHALGKEIPEPISVLNKKEEYLSLLKLMDFIKRIQSVTSIEVRELIFQSSLEEYKTLKELKETRNTLKELTRIKFPDNSLPSVLQEYSSLRKYSKEIKEISKAVLGKETELSKIKNKIEELENTLKDYKVCPLCGHELEE